MCNLYSLNKKRDMVASMFRVHNRATSYEPLPAIFPGRVAIGSSSCRRRKCSRHLRQVPVQGGDPLPRLTDSLVGELDRHDTSITAMPALRAMRIMCAVPRPPGNATTSTGLWLSSIS